MVEDYVKGNSYLQGLSYYAIILCMQGFMLMLLACITFISVTLYLMQLEKYRSSFVDKLFCLSHKLIQKIDNNPEILYLTILTGICNEPSKILISAFFLVCMFVCMLFCYYKVSQMHITHIKFN